MSDDFEKDPLVYTEHVKRQMEEDPELAVAMREFAANMRQAFTAWKGGQYTTFEDAMEAITGQRPKLVDIDDLPDEAKRSLDEIEIEDE